MALGSCRARVQATGLLTSTIEAMMLLFQSSKVLFAVMLAAMYVVVEVTEDLLWLCVAVSRRMTLLEMKNVWNYKHCFEVKTEESEGKNYFQIKHVSLIQQLRNVGWFLAGRNVIGKAGKVKTGAKVVQKNGDTYEDIAITHR